LLDIIIEHGEVVDGTGRPGFGADIGVKGDRIAEIGDLSATAAERRIDASGLTVSPGFIDIHTHSDFSLLVNGKAESQIHQGVTTEVVGNCGHSCAPCKNKARLKTAIFGYHDSIDITWETFDEYLSALEAQRLGVNVAAYVGHGTLRIAAMDGESRTASNGEVAEMSRLLEESLDGGAIGFSTGLEYAPGSAATTEEVIELCKVLSRYDRIYATHVRNREVHCAEGFGEAFETARRADVRTQISHIVPKFAAPPGSMENAIRSVETINESGHDIAFDIIPHEWGPTTMSSALPPWAFDGGISATLERLRDPVARKKMKTNDNPIWQLISLGRWDLIQLFHSQANRDSVGLTFDAIALRRGVSAFDAVLDILLEEGDTLYSVTWAARNFAEKDIVMAMQQSICGIISDTITLAPYGVYEDTSWSPSTYGWTARFLGKFVRDMGVISLEDGVCRLTGLAAKRMALGDRGELRTGAKADVAVFDIGTITDNTTNKTPNVYSSGIQYVMVNGRIAIDAGNRTTENAGVVLRAS
jgi:N-acyl-D-aspartate/D-glutamate deacylase